MCNFVQKLSYVFFILMYSKKVRIDLLHVILYL